MSSKELETKVKKAAEVVISIPGLAEEGNAYTPFGAEEYIWNKLAEMQIGKDETSHEMLMSEYTKEGDMRAVFCEGSKKIAVPWFRKIFAILKGKNGIETEVKDESNEVVSSIQELIKSNRLISQWKDGELVSALNPDCSYEIVDELKKRSNGWSVVAFEDEEKEVVNIEVTLKMLQQSRRREVPQMIRQNGKTYRLYEVGKWPNAVFMECPLHEGVLLTENYCDECEVDYDGISKDALVFLRVLSNRGDINDNDKLRLKDLVKTAREEGVKGLRELFPKAAFEYDDLKKSDELPSLKSRTSVSKSRRQDPLNPGGRIY